MTRSGERVFIEGGAGRIETVIDAPPRAPRGVALIAHPHPLFGGSLDNKVVQTLAKTFVELGYVALRPNFRGVGQSEGEHDHGEGETQDMRRVAAYARSRFGELPLVLAGYSFGAFVQVRAAKRAAPERLVLVAPPSGLASGTRRYELEPVPQDTIVIHGELDETVPLANVLAWARPQDLPVTVIAGADHFFHRRLHLIKRVVKNRWR